MGTFSQFLNEIDNRKPRVRAMNGTFVPVGNGADPGESMGAQHAPPPQRNGGTIDFQKPNQRYAAPQGQVKAGELTPDQQAKLQAKQTAQQKATQQAAQQQQAQAAANDPVNQFTALAADRHIRNDMIAMLGTIYQRKRENPNDPLVEPAMVKAIQDPQAKSAVANLFKYAEKLSTQQMAVLAKKISKVGVQNKVTLPGAPNAQSAAPASAAQTPPPAAKPTAPQQQAAAAPPGQQGQAQPTTQARMNRLQGLLQSVQPALNPQQVQAVLKAVNQSKKKSP